MVEYGNNGAFLFYFILDRQVIWGPAQKDNLLVYIDRKIDAVVDGKQEIYL